jgi:ribosome maturation factor RimP
MASVLRGRLIALIEPVLTGLGYELVELEFSPSRGHALLRIFIDRPHRGLPEAVDENGTAAENGAGRENEKNVEVSLDSEGQVEGDAAGITESGIGIEDCARVSREVSALLDVEDPIPSAYTLEVSSPGSDRVLRTRSHFDRFAGSRVFVELKVPREGRKRYTGQLRSVNDAGVELEVDGQAVAVLFDEIEKARLAPEVAGSLRR